MYDPRKPTRPIRILPTGRVEVDTSEFQAFRQYAYDNNLPIRLVDNPKRPKSLSWKRYKRYQMATTLREIVELSLTAKDMAKRREQRATALKDITNDALRGYIMFPAHENRSRHHYVNASDLAAMYSTTNIFALYSRSELEAAQKDYKLKRSAKYQAMNKRFLVKGYLTFQEQIEYLWDDEAKPAPIVDEKCSAETIAMISELFNGDLPEPTNYKEASSPNHPEYELWKASMERERRTLEERGTWELVPRSSIGKHRPVKCKYVYKRKRNKDGSIQLKSRLVACGYSQIPGVDFSIEETYAGVCSYSSMRFLLSYGCQMGYILDQTDITGAYLESYLHEDVYMEVPPDMRINGKPPKDEQGRELVCKLKRGLYGLKQSAHHWQQCFKTFLTEDPRYNMGFHEMTGEPNMYRKRFELNGKMEEVLLGIYVDDCLLLSSSSEAREWFMSRLKARFPVNPKSTGSISFE